MLTGEAFNALLKTLEEPPDYCLFILATTEPQKVPITIRSRCQLIRFEKGSLKVITQKLQSIVEAQGFTVEPAVLSLIAVQAEGGFRDSETLLETLCNQFDPLTLSQTQNSLGLLETELVERLINSALTGQLDDLTALLRGKVQPLSGSLERLIAQMINQVRLLLYQDKPETALIAYLLDQLLIAYLTQKGSPVPIVGLEIALFNTAEMNNNTNATTNDVIELRSVITVDSPSSPPEPVPQTVAKGLISAPLASPSVPVVELNQDKIKDVRKAWKLTIERIARENMILAQALKETIFHTAVSNTITIHVRFKFHADKMREKKNHQLIQSTLEDMTGQKWEIEYIVANQTPKERILKKLPSNLQDAVGVFQDPE